MVEKLLLSLLAIAFALWLARQVSGIVRTDRALLTAEHPDDFVAEVWLEWPVCRGSTMYRGRFPTAAKARKAARRHAARLDYALPSHYPSEDSSGNRFLERHEYGIHWGVRKLSPLELEEGVRSFYTDVLPGYKGYQGEHPLAHPMRDAFESSFLTSAGLRT